MVQHLALPVRVDGTGRLAGVEQDSVTEIAQNVSVILATRVGSRMEVSEFGSPAVDFTTAPDVAGIRAAVEDWEPRADLDVTAVVGRLDGAETLAEVRAVVSTTI